jgi:Phytanoyl-CoA dioxygenase (PhyH)
VGVVDEMRSANTLLSDAGALRRRLAEDGYLFFRNLLPSAEVGEAADGVRAALRRGGWIDRRGNASAERHALNPKDALDNPAFRAANTGPAFNRIPYLMPLRQTVRMILGPAAFSYPAKVLRAIYPERLPEATRGRYIHRDYAVSGVQDMLTTWVPLSDIPVRLGGLAVRPGSHLDPPRRPRLLGQDEPGWATADYRAGDALVFHCLTAHAALPNQDTMLRLSGDFRWQSSDQPVPAQLVLGNQGQQWEIFSRLFAREPWWEPVPAGMTLVPRERLIAVPPGPSRFFRVHPDWRFWQPPPEAVH